MVIKGFYFTMLFLVVHSNFFNKKKKERKGDHVAHLFSRREYSGVMLCRVCLTIMLCQTHLWGAQPKDNIHNVNTPARSWPSALKFNFCLSF